MPHNVDIPSSNEPKKQPEKPSNKVLDFFSSVRDIFGGKEKSQVNPSRRRFLQSSAALATTALLTQLMPEQIQAQSSKDKNSDKKPSKTASESEQTSELEFTTEEEHKNLEKMGLSEFLNIFELNKKFEVTFGFTFPAYDFLRTTLRDVALGETQEDIERRQDSYTQHTRTAHEPSFLETLKKKWGTLKDEAEERALAILPDIQYKSVFEETVSDSKKSEVLKVLFETFPLSADVIPLTYIELENDNQLEILCGSSTAAACTNADMLTAGNDDSHEKTMTYLLHEMIHHVLILSGMNEPRNAEIQLVAAYAHYDKFSFLSYVETITQDMFEYLQFMSENEDKTSASELSSLASEIPWYYREHKYCINLIDAVTTLLDTGTEPTQSPDNIAEKSTADITADDSLKLYTCMQRVLKVLKNNDRVGEKSARHHQILIVFASMFTEGIMHHRLTLPLESTGARQLTIYQKHKKNFLEKILPIISCGQMASTKPVSEIRAQLGLE